MKLTNSLQLIDKLQQAGKIDNLQQVCGFGLCISTPGQTMLVSLYPLRHFWHLMNGILKTWTVTFLYTLL